MKHTNWILHLFYKQKLKSQQSSEFKLKNEADALHSSCLQEINETTKHLWLEIKKYIHKLGIKRIQNNRSRIYRDKFGVQLVLPNPVFSENQIATIKRKHTYYIIVVFFFTFAESLLYFLTASLYIPGSPIYLQLIISLFLGFIIFYGLSYSFEKHFYYIEALERHLQKLITDQQLKAYRHERTIGYIILGFSTFAIVFSGLARIFFFQYFDTSGLSKERIANVLLASNFASLFSLAITIIAALFLAAAKREQFINEEKYAVYKTWHQAHVTRNLYSQIIIRDVYSMLHDIEQITEKYWQCIVDLKRIFLPKVEYDEKFEQLHQKYLIQRDEPGFSVTKEIYTRYSALQTAYRELFIFGIYHHTQLEQKISDLQDILKIAEQHLEEHSQIYSSQKFQPTNETTSNGMPHSNCILNQLNITL